MSFLREPGAEPIPGYHLIEPLGSGGFGEAWKCVAPGDILKAIKFVYGNLNSLDVEGARAEQELKALHRVKQVRYPFVLPMDRIEVVEGELVIVMELADRSLHDAYTEAVASGLRGIPRDTLLRYMRDAADALDHMAGLEEPLQHLDIKPRNLFLVSDRVKVADFGLVKYVQNSNASGLLGGVTPLYAPPETFTGEVSINSDQYSLAIVYMELLTGQRPFTGKNVRQLAQAHMSAEPDLRALPEAERPILARALSKKPSDRWPNCLSFIRALLMTRPQVVAPTTGGVGGANRPRTMADTMEDIFLGGDAGDELIPVELDDPEEESVLARSGEAISRLGVTMALPQTGSLRPTLVIGLGAYGRRALVDLRCRMIDRFGDLERVPMFRFLYVDTDQDAIRASVRGAPEMALTSNEVYQLPLQPVAHYRRRQLDQLNDWLPREKLYALPRSLKTQGSRALGRLAFTDNYLRLQARLRRDLQAVSHPDAIYQSVSQTGLALRDNVPRVYVIASAAGGSSGYLVDLGYTVRRVLDQLHQRDAQVISFLFTSTPEDPATPKSELANVYATLTEVNHFSEPGIPFSAQYGTDGPRLVNEVPAFNAAYLVPIQHRTPEARRESLSHLSSYLFHEISTPLGIRLDRSRDVRSPDATLFRSFGTYGVWFPRGLMLRLAAWTALEQILEHWQRSEPVAPTPELEACHARIVADPEFQPDALVNRIAEKAAGELEAPPAEALTRFLATLEEQSQHVVALEDPVSWARQTVQRMRDWLGSGLLSTSQELCQARGESSFNPIHQRKSKLTRALESAANMLAEEWDHRFIQSVSQLMEHPGERLAIAEVALERLVKLCDEGALAMRTRLEQSTHRTSKAQEQLDIAVQNCAAGASGFTWFGGKTRRNLRVVLDHLAAFSRQCLAEDLAASVWGFFVVLRGRLQDRLRDLTLCRQRIRHTLETLGTIGHLDEFGHSSNDSLTPSHGLASDKFWEMLRDMRTARVVLPAGVSDLEQAANSFLRMLTPEQWTALDQSFQDQVLSVRGGLYQACTTVSDIGKHLVQPLLNQAITYLSSQLPITDVAEVELGLDSQLEGDLRQRIESYYDSALPLLCPAAEKPLEPQSRYFPETHPAPIETPGFLLVPASEAGRQYGQIAEEAMPKLTQLTVPGQAELVVCREQPILTLEDLDRFLKSCRKAYEQAVTVPGSSPHSRFDIIDWSPLDP